MFFLNFFYFIFFIYFYLFFTLLYANKRIHKYINFISPNVVASVKQKCREDRQRQTITDSIKKTSEHANETTTYNYY